MVWWLTDREEVLREEKIVINSIELIFFFLLIGLIVIYPSVLDK